VLAGHGDRRNGRRNERDTSRGLPRSFTAQRTLVQDDGRAARLFNIVLDLCAEPCNNYAVPLDEFGGVVPLAEVRLQEGESLENALRRFKRKVQQEDIIKEVKRHSFYLKPGEKKRVKEALARKRSRKKARKEQD
jgi:small subunit ribosomal protein S21